MNEKISVIVPVYNVSEYLDKCINSICSQTYSNLEIILVDDGSKDNSGEICESWRDKDERIIVYHKENGGLSSARNYGIDRCSGDYIVFIDSDDYIKTDMIEKLYRALISTESDLAICNFFYDKNDEISFKKLSFERKCFYGDEKFLNLYNELSMQTVVSWNKLYKRKLFNTIRYPLGKLHEDEFIICEILENAEQVCYISEPLYFYVQRNGSIMKIFNLKRFDCVEAFVNRISFFEELKNDRLVSLTRYSLLYSLIVLLASLSANKKLMKSNISIYKKNFNLLKELAHLLKNNQYMSNVQKIKCHLIAIFPNVYLKIFLLIKKAK